MDQIRLFAKWIWERADPLLALVLALVFAWKGVTGSIKDSTLVSATLATLTVLAFTLVRERDGRQRLETHLRQLQEQFRSQDGEPNADTFFTRNTDEQSVLGAASNEAWLIQETGRKVLEDCKQAIVNLLNNGGCVRMVMATPTQETASLLALRNANMTMKAILNRHREMYDHFADIANQAGTEKFEVRFFSYPVSTTSVIVDPQSPFPNQRRGIVREAGFYVPYEDKLDFILEASQSPKVFNHYYEETRRVFFSSSKILLLEGLPRSGKTTILESLAHEFSTNPNLFFVLSHAVKDNGERSGFEVETTCSTKRTKFARRQPDGKYAVIDGVWKEIAELLIEAKNCAKVLLVDEIGKMQLEEPTFLQFCKGALDDPSTVLIASVGGDTHHPYLRELKHHYRCTTIQLRAGENETEVRNQLRTELRFSLRTAQYVPLCKEVRNAGVP